jgi:hypothetical protein
MGGHARFAAPDPAHSQFTIKKQKMKTLKYVFVLIIIAATAMSCTDENVGPLKGDDDPIVVPPPPPPPRPK